MAMSSAPARSCGHRLGRPRRQIYAGLPGIASSVRPSTRQVGATSASTVGAPFSSETHRPISCPAASYATTMSPAETSPSNVHVCVMDLTYPLPQPRTDTFDLGAGAGRSQRHVAPRLRCGSIRPGGSPRPSPFESAKRGTSMQYATAVVGHALARAAGGQAPTGRCGRRPDHDAAIERLLAGVTQVDETVGRRLACCRHGARRRAADAISHPSTIAALFAVATSSPRRAGGTHHRARSRSTRRWRSRPPRRSRSSRDARSIDRDPR